MKTTLQSAAILAVAAVVLEMAYCWLISGNFLHSITKGWFWETAGHMSLPIWWPLAPVALIALYGAFSLIGKFLVPSYSYDEMELHQGITGEVLIAPWYCLIAMILTNFFEEMLFRFALIPLILLVLFWAPTMVSAIVAVGVSAVLFWLAHGQYRNTTSTILTILAGLLLGALYVMSGSLLLCFITHACYNLFTIAFGRWQLSHNPDFFGGKQPTNLITEMLNKD